MTALTAIQHQISELTSRLTGLETVLSELQTSLIPKQPNDSTPQVLFSSLFAQQNASPTLEEATFVSKVSVRLQDSVKREKNIIIMGAKENNNTQNQDKDTTDYVSKLFKFLKLNNLIIKGCKRLRGVGSYPGIIKVFLNSSEDRQAVLKSTKSLRTSHDYKDVYINPDLTPEERIFEKSLILDMKNSNKARSEDECSIFHWAIRNRKVVKILSKDPSNKPQPSALMALKFDNFKPSCSSTSAVVQELSSVSSNTKVLLNNVTKESTQTEVKLTTSEEQTNQEGTSNQASSTKLITQMTKDDPTAPSGTLSISVAPVTSPVFINDDMPSTFSENNTDTVAMEQEQAQ